MPDIRNTVGAQPENSNACGAYCLTAIAESLLAFPISINLSHQSPHGALPAATYHCDPVNVVTPALASNIYGVTGDPFKATLVAPVNTQANLAGILRNAVTGLNLPSGLCRVASQLRFVNITVNITSDCETRVLPTAGFSAQEITSEIACCEGLPRTTANREVSEYTVPGIGEAQLVCVEKNGAMHWLARADSENYYDPADGTNDNNWGSPTGVGVQTLWEGYNWIGLWITLE